MLVLSRKYTEEIVITLGGERVIVTLIEVRGDKVRLGFTANESVKIIRSELEKRDADRLPPGE